MKQPEILLIGSGGIGSFYGGKLAASGIDVSIVCRSDYEVVKEKGIFIRSKDGDFHFQPRQVVKKVADYQGRPDFILVTTKVLPEVNLFDLIKDRVYPETIIVLLQNGIDIESPVARFFPGNELISGLLYIASTRVEPGVVLHQGFGDIVLGTYPGGISPGCKQLGDLFAGTGLKCTLVEDIVTMRWKKLSWNAPFSVIPVLSRGYTVDQLLEDSQCEQLIFKVTREIMLLAEKNGHPLPDDLIEFNLNISRNLPGYKPSMLIDYENKRPMEVEAILGNAVALAAQYQVPVPCLSTLYALLALVDKKNRQE